MAQSYADALAWYRAAADQGDAYSQNAIGYLYWLGTGVPRDPVEAVRWFQLAAAQGNVQSQATLGAAYERGEGIAQDLQQAMTWYFKSAYAGDIIGAYNLATLYESGKADTFLQPDPPKAKYWYAAAEAAMQGLGDAVPATIKAGAMEGTARLAGTTAAASSRSPSRPTRAASMPSLPRACCRSRSKATPKPRSPTAISAFSAPA